MTKAVPAMPGLCAIFVWDLHGEPKARHLDDNCIGIIPACMYVVAGENYLTYGVLYVRSV